MTRSWAALVSWAIATAALVTGLGVAVCQVTPDNLLGVDAYVRVFSVHAACGLALLPLLLVPMGKAEWLSAPRARGTALGLVVAGTSLMVLADSLGGRVPLLAAPLGALVQSFGVLLFAVAVGRWGKESRVARICRVAALVWLGAWLGLQAALPMLLTELLGPTQIVIFEPQAFLMLLHRASSTLGIGTALGATAAVALANARRIGGLATAATVCALGMVAGALVHHSALFVALPAGMFFGVQAFSVAVTAPTRWKRWIRGAQAVVFIETVLAFAWLSASDEGVYLHDTLFITGASHLGFFAGALGWLQASNPVEERSAAVGLGAILAGGHGLVLAHLVLGAQGHPRRYVAYLADQDGWLLLHGLAALAGAVLLVGCAVMALAMKERERPGTF